MQAVPPERRAQRAVTVTGWGGGVKVWLAGMAVLGLCKAHCNACCLTRAGLALGFRFRVLTCCSFDVSCTGMQAAFLVWQ